MRVRDAEREARAWVTDVAALLREPGSRRRFETAGHLPELAVSGSAIDERATITLDARIESVSEGVLVTASITAPWHGSCRRCLEPATGLIETEMCELFSDDGAEESYPLGGELLDLAPLVRDACILELPLAPLCSAECRGLCPECGVNRNTESCTCAPAGDPRWAVLATLKDSASEQAHEKDA
jgi:uncharacterized protein